MQLLIGKVRANIMTQYLINDLSISKNIVNLRKNAGMTQEYVAIQLQTMGLNISRSRLSMIELGRLNVPISLLVGLKNIFNCNYCNFFDGLDEIFAAKSVE
jgi:transcriptional regulator with XRE-family HTH domain